MITTNKLFQVTSVQVVTPDVGGPITLHPGTVVWMHGSRPSSLGGYIGIFSLVYEQANGLSPKDITFALQCEHVRPSQTGGLSSKPSRMP